MHMRTSTLRGHGVEIVEGGRPIKTDEIQVSARFAARLLTAEAVKICLASATVSMSVEEIRVIVQFLRLNGIEIDPMREKQRRVAWALAQSFGSAPAIEAANPGSTTAV